MQLNMGPIINQVHLVITKYKIYKMLRFKISIDKIFDCKNSIMVGFILCKISLLFLIFQRIFPNNIKDNTYTRYTNTSIKSLQNSIYYCSLLTFRNYLFYLKSLPSPSFLLFRITEMIFL
eukprot:TRINITY_DN3806_c1_g4_i1.p1 TRINITY_DN3806_c1_g4~~TRINITY_DN3806_c1_g4_i1.p1  ORF type:complete len:120 (-),score=1.73 TRINITY_DN3806_c1_g4_i1:313-672(-)